MSNETDGADPAGLWARAGRGFRAGPVLLMTHDDADGLSSCALLLRGLERAGREVRVRLVGRGETAWEGPLVQGGFGGVVIADLGMAERLPHPGVPTVILDHHVPRGNRPDATVIHGHGMEPQPNTSVLAHRAVGAPAAEAWVTALGIIGDMNEAAGFPELDLAKSEGHRITHLRDAASLVNAPRRAANPDARPALDLILKSDGPKDLLSGRHPETAALLAAKEEVRRESEAARRIAPVVRGEVALIRLASPCQIHPLVAQSWARRLAGKVVIAANTAFRPGFVHFAARTSGGHDLVHFFRARAPEGADVHYGGGHAGASGGALRTEVWDRFVESLGFGPEGQAASFPERIAA